MSFKTVFFTFSFSLFFFIYSYSQTDSLSKRIKIVGVQFGFNSFTGETENLDKIRANISYFDSQANSLESLLNTAYAGLKFELRSSNNQFALSLGLHYSYMLSSTKEGSASSSSFFYFLINDEGTTTEYLRVNELNQAISYVSVPIDFKYFPNFRSRFRPYINMGLEYSLKLQNKLDVSFYDSSMDSRKEELANQLINPKSSCLLINPAIGIELGRGSKPSLGFQMNLPIFVASKEVSSLMTPNLGVGFQLNFIIPIK